MYGLKRNTERLFSNNGKLFVMAMDLPQTGMVKGLEKPRELLRSVENSRADGFIVNVGIADEMASGGLLNKKLILRSSCKGSMQATEFSNVNVNHVSPEMALAYGADAVLMMCTIGGADYVALQKMAEDIDAFHKLHIPVIAEVMCDDYMKTVSYDIQLNGARIAAELGADVVKGFYTEKFENVVGCCPVPFIMAGGDVSNSIVDMAKDALACGAKGLAVGRNIFQSEDPAATIAELAKLFD